MKLNLGSGLRNLKGYINIDAVKQTPDTVVGNLLELDYVDNSIDEIYSEHVIEHFTRPELDRYFSESKRMLKPSGKFVIIAPSIIKVLERFNKGEVDINYIDSFLFARHLHEYDFHKQSIYKEKLIMLCDKHGFKITKLEYQDRNFSKNEIVLEAYRRNK